MAESKIDVTGMSLTDRTRLLARDDMNNITTPGYYYQSAGSAYMPANAPSGAYNAAIFVFNVRPQTDIVQIWMSLNAQKIFMRSKFAELEWTSWTVVVDWSS